MSVAPDLLATLPGRIAADLHALLPGLRTCEGIDGQFDVAELKRVGKTTPAVLVALMSADQDEETPSWPQIGFSLGLAAFVVTRTSSVTTAAAAAQTIAQAILARVPETDWDIPELGPATRVALRTLTTQESRAQQVHLIGITWRQKAVLEAVTLADPVPLSIYASQAPEIGPPFIDSYELIAGPGEAP